MKKRMDKEQFELLRESRKLSRKTTERYALEMKEKNLDYIEPKKRSKS